MSPSPTTVAPIILPISLLAIIFLVVYPNDLRLQTLTTSCLFSAATNPSPSSTTLNFTGLDVTPKPDFRLLIGILTLPDLYERRHMLRMVYSLQSVATARIDIKFVFCNLTKPEQRTLVALEIMRFGDIIILNCTENMNKGKTFTYFSSLPKILNLTADGQPPYDYVMKADDDIYFRLSRLAQSLRSKPREDFYYGFVIPCGSMDPFHDYMSGMGYMVSWDLVEWIATSNVSRGHSEGTEDLLFGSWLTEGNKAKHRFNTKPAMYDYPIPVPIDTCSHEFVPDTIAVHRLKDHPKWARTLDYFNVTAGLEPSKLYHIP